MSENFRMLVVANPNSANGALGRHWARLSKTIEANCGAFSYEFTEKTGDGSRIARKALLDGFEMVVAMGGDGTISEVADGFFDEEEPINDRAALGVLPFGTGGDLRKTACIPKALPKSARQLAGRKTRRIDVGRMFYTTPTGERKLRHFVNIASFGISGLVDKLVNESSKAFGGKLSFAVATIRAMRQYKPQTARIQFDDEDPKNVNLQTVAVANGQYFGGGMHIAPKAKLDDGLFDVVTLKPTSLADLVLHGYKVYTGAHLNLPHVSFTQARRVIAEPVNENDRIFLDVDGETPGMLPATFELLPAALRLKNL